MKALWIRVEAHEVDSVRIAGLADTLDIEPVYALGHYVALAGAIAEQAPDGNISGVRDATIERWAHWRGKRGAFVMALRENALITDDGVFSDWRESMGKLIERRERERLRKAGKGAENRDNSAARGAETRHVSGAEDAEKPSISGATERDVTERNGSSERSLKRSGEYGGDPENPADRAASAPPADAPAVRELPRDAAAFLNRFYRDPGTRRTDVAQQILATLNGGAKLDKDTRVRAGSVDRLEAKCREVISEGVRSRDKAIVVLLKKLDDMSDVTETAARVESHERAEEERATTDDLAHADAWLRDHARVALAIDQQLAVDGFTPDHIGFAIARRSRILTAWRNAGAPEVSHV
jgi:hypothetical protein